MPEKFMANILNQLNIMFISQYSTEWSNNKRYDFYIPIKNCIIETHGLQHYEHRSFSKNNPKTLEDEQTNDKFKRELALSNGIKHYIELDCRKSELEWIKNSIMQSNLPNILDFKLEDVDWLRLHEDSYKNLILEVCNLWNEGKRIVEICKIAKKGDTTIRRYLVKGDEIGWSNYKPKSNNNKSS